MLCDGDGAWKYGWGGARRRGRRICGRGRRLVQDVAHGWVPRSEDEEMMDGGAGGHARPRCVRACSGSQDDQRRRALSSASDNTSTVTA
jgi:hypothetical protein